jgi:hypothetical protein
MEEDIKILNTIAYDIAKIMPLVATAVNKMVYTE